MKEFNEKMKKEYATPQMEIMDCKVQGFLCGSDSGIICDDTNGGCDGL